MPYLLFFILLVGCTQLSPLTRTQVIMGTFCSITLDASKSTHIETGFNHLRQVESILSSYQPTALVTQLNTQRKIATDKMLKDILEKSKEYYKDTNGYFDITVGSITKELYRFGENERVPTQTQLNNAPLAINNIQLDPDYISLKGDIVIDLGGIGKGYGVDSLSHYYASQGISEGKIALFGDIRCLNTCEVAIQSPFEEEHTLGTLYAKSSNLSVSTSGTYRRYVKQKRHHHLINPKTKTQGNAFVSVTIIANNDNTLCDVMATAISTMHKSVALEFVRSQNRFGYLLVTPSGEMIRGNLEKFVHFKQSPHTIKNKK